MPLNFLKNLCGSQIEIVETHHCQKQDSPSGTALMLADSINKANDNRYFYNFNRHDAHEKRYQNEIGFSSIRGGNIVGEHSILFFGEQETFELKHTSYSRSIYAQGAIKAAKFLVEMNQKHKTGLFDMKHLFFST